MSAPLNRAEARDYIRRKLQITPPVDYGTGAVGEQPTYFPDPSNAAINQALDDALSEYVVRVGYQVAPAVAFSIAAQTANGAYLFAINGLPGQPYAQGFHEIRRMSWTPTGGVNQTLRAVDRHFLDSKRMEWQNDVPGQPLRYWIEGGNVYVHPAPSTAGTLTIMAGMGVAGYMTDDDTIENLPADYHKGVYATAIRILAEMRPQNVEMQAIAAQQAQNSERWLRDTQKLEARRAAQSQPTLTFRSYRRRY